MSFPLQHPSHPIPGRKDSTAQLGSATRVPRNATIPQNTALPLPRPPSRLQATVGAQLRATALQPLFAMESVPLVPTSLVLRPRQTTHHNPAAEPRAVLVPCHTVKPCYILSRVRLDDQKRCARHGVCPRSMAEQGSEARNHVQLGFLRKRRPAVIYLSPFREIQK